LLVGLTVCWQKSCHRRTQLRSISLQNSFSYLKDLLCLVSMFAFLLHPNRGGAKMLQKNPNRSIVMSMFVCLSVCVFVCDHISGTTRLIFTNFFVHVTCGHGMVLLWWRSDMLFISRFVDDIIFAHKLIGCSTSPPGWASDADTYAALSLAHRNTRCRQRTLVTILAVRAY